MRVSIAQVTLGRAANNGTCMTPILLLTRPEDRNASFAADVTSRWQGPLRVISSPLLKITFLAATPPAADEMIFTSVNGVRAACHLGLPTVGKVWCVGGRTAEEATEAGFAVETGPGDADGLVQHIIAANPTGRLAHIRGMHARGAVAESLNAAGLICQDVVAYDQLPNILSAEARAALKGEYPVIVPLFSPRTATILKEQGPYGAAIYLFAMSAAVADAVTDVPVTSLMVAPAPDAASMVDTVVAALEGLGAT